MRLMPSKSLARAHWVAWGAVRHVVGSEGLDTAAVNSVDSSQIPIKLSTGDISAWCNCKAPPYSVSAPVSLLAEVSDALDVGNSIYAESERCNQHGWKATCAPP